MLEEMEEELNDLEVNRLIDDYGLFVGTKEESRNREGRRGGTAMVAVHGRIEGQR